MRSFLNIYFKQTVLKFFFSFNKFYYCVLFASKGWNTKNKTLKEFPKFHFESFKIKFKFFINKINICFKSSAFFITSIYYKTSYDILVQNLFCCRKVFFSGIFSERMVFFFLINLEKKKTLKVFFRILKLLKIVRMFNIWFHLVLPLKLSCEVCRFNEVIKRKNESHKQFRRYILAN